MRLGIEFHGQCGFGPDALAKRPVLAVHLAAIIGGWSHIEGMLAAHLGLFGGPSPQEALKLIRELNTGHRRTAELKRRAGLVLPDAHFAVLEPLLEQSRAIAGKRNELVHSVWGTSDEHPDALVMAHWSAIAAPVVELVLGGVQGNLPTPEYLLRHEMRLIHSHDLEPIQREIAAFIQKATLMMTLQAMDRAIVGLGNAAADGTSGSGAAEA